MSLSKAQIIEMSMKYLYLPIEMVDAASIEDLCSILIMAIQKVQLEEYKKNMGPDDNVK